MMLRTADNEYIQVPDVEVERQAKLFQSIGDTSGDFSYEFEIDNNSDNLDKLGIISPVDGFQKTIYTVSDVALLDDEGSVLYMGYVRVQSIQDTIALSFFSGNNNWFSVMVGDLIDLDLSSYIIEKNLTNIIASWNNNDGIVFPLMNTGSVGNRSRSNWTLEDYQPFIYVKNIISECFRQAGLKISGELLDDWRYQHLITSTIDVTIQQELEDRKVNVSKIIDQVISTAPTYEVLELEVENFVGTHSNWDNVNYRYVADVPMIVQTTTTITNTGGGGSQGITVRLLINGTTEVDGFSRGNNDTFTINSPRIRGGVIKPIFLDSGDYLDIQLTSVASSNTITSAQFEVRPIKILEINPVTLLPKISRIDFVTEVFKLFNTVIDYDPFTKTVTVDFFKNVIRNDELDISEYIDPSTIRVDYTELIGDYGKENILRYSESDNEIIEKYNDAKDIPYGAGMIESANDFAEDKKDIIDSIFVATPEDSNNPIGTSLPRVEFTTEDYGQEFTATVTNSSGSLFTVTNFVPQVGELINVSDSTVDSYLGNWLIDTVVSPSTFTVDSMPYVSNANVTIRKFNVVQNSMSDQILLLAVPDTALSDFSDYSGISPMYAYFYKPFQNRNIDDYDRSLSFGPVEINNAYQRTMIEDYWGDLGPILQDPIKIYVDAYLPKSVFESITFKQPIRLKTDRFNARFIPNRITGYKNSSSPCTLELIKLGN
jgi:hypothetical protein